MNKELTIAKNLLTSTSLFEIPSDVDDCMSLINKGCSALEKSTVLTKWHIGRIIDHLLTIGVKSVYNTLEDSTGYKRRFLAHSTRFYKAFKDIDTINALCAKGIQWHILRELPKLLEKKRASVIDKILTEDLSKDEIIALAESAYDTKEKTGDTFKESKEEGTTYIDVEPIEHTVSDNEEIDSKELRFDSKSRTGRKKDSWEGDAEAKNSEKWFFEYNQKLVRLEKELADTSIEVPDYLQLKDSSMVNDNKWAIINKIIDKIVTNTDKLKRALDIFRNQCKDNLDSFTNNEE